MSIQVIDNFEVRVQKAIDNRFVVGTGQFYTDKNDIEYKYPGLRVWDLDAGVSGVPFVWDGAAWVSEATASVTGGGTIGTIPKFQGSSNNLGDSIIKESSSQIGIGLAGTPTEKLDVNGNVKATKFIGLAWSGGSGLTNINLGTNGSNVIGTIALTNLQNGSQGRILVAGAAAPEWLDQVQIGTTPASGSPGNGLYFKNTVTSRLYATSGSGLRFTIGSTNTLDVVEGQIRVSNGSAGSPAISFIGDPNTGIYNVSGDIMGFSTGGSQRLNISTVDVVASVPIKVPNGTVADPGLKVGSNFTGLSREVVSTLPNVEEYLKLSVNQTLLLSLNRTGYILAPDYDITSYYPFRNAYGSESAPSYSFNGNANTGMYWYGANSLGFSLAGKLRWRMRLGSATDFEFWNHNGSSGFNGAFANYGSYLKLQDFTHLEIGGSGPFGLYVNNSVGIGTTTFAYTGSGASDRRYHAGSSADWNGFSSGTAKLAVNGGIGCQWIVTTSDKRLKKNITPINTSLNKILKLNAVEYEWNNELTDNLKNYGFIAQEVEQVIPEIIRYYEDDELEGGKMTIHYESIISHLTKAIQEQQEIINSFEERLKKLE